MVYSLTLLMTSKNKTSHSHTMWTLIVTALTLSCKVSLFEDVSSIHYYKQIEPFQIFHVDVVASYG